VAARTVAGTPKGMSASDNKNAKNDLLLIDPSLAAGTPEQSRPPTFNGESARTALRGSEATHHIRTQLCGKEKGADFSRGID